MIDELIVQLRAITDKLQWIQLEEHNIVAARVLHHCVRGLLDIVQGLDLYFTIKGEQNERHL
ncbi:MAG: hypothetical protein KBG83_00080 [Bacteroidetes bacterium]|jgi:hypothetical protein|nr:hypothetical protein [Bacteroidota bacterium]